MLLLLHQTLNAGPVLSCHRDLRNSSCFTDFVRTAGLNEYSPTAVSSATVINDCQYFFIREELVQIFNELLPLQEISEGEWRMFTGNLVLANFGEFIVT